MMDVKLVSFAALMLFTGSVNTIATKMQVWTHHVSARCGALR
jgi:hypothetical protein